MVLALSSLPLVSPQSIKPLLVMLVYPDGTVGFTSSYSGTIEPSEGVSSMYASLNVARTTTGSKVELNGGYVFEGDTLVSLAEVFSRFNVGAVIDPSLNRTLVDFLIGMKTGGYLIDTLVQGEIIYLMGVNGRATISGQTIDATIQIIVRTQPLYTAAEFNSWVQTYEAMYEPMITSSITQMGLTVTSLVLTPTAPDTYTSNINVHLVLQGNLTQLIEQGGQAQVIFDPILILGAFVARPNDLSRGAINFTSSTGVLEGDLVLNYLSDYDTLINANREGYLNSIEAIAEQDLTNGEQWLPLIRLLKPAQLTALQAGFNLRADFHEDTLTWSGQFPKMKVGEVTGHTLSLKSFLDALGPTDQYTKDEENNPSLNIAIQGVEDASYSMEIVVPGSTPAPSSRPNATTAVWEGVYIDQLDDVSFTLHPKDTTPPTITPGIASGATVSEKRPTLTAALSDDVAVDPSTIVVKVDGVDVTSSATTSATSVSYTPASDLQDGSHTFYVSVEDTAGNLQQVTVNFTVSSGIPTIYLIGIGAVAVIVVVGAAALFLTRKKPSAVQGPAPPPPPPPA